MNGGTSVDDNINADLAAIGVRRLTPENTILFSGTFSILHCAVKGDDVYRGVFAVRTFPIRQPDTFISLHYTNPGDKEREIGIIMNLKDFPSDQQELVNISLRAHYCERIIRRIYRIRHEYGLLFFDVETDRGKEQFIMPWRGDRAEDYGDEGKVLLDAVDNRYIIPRLLDLPSLDHRRLVSFVYW